MLKYRFGYVFLFLAQFCYGAVHFYEGSENMRMHECVMTMIQRIELVNSTDITLINVNVSLAKELHSVLEHPVRFISRSFYWPNDTLYNDVYVIQCADYFMFAHGLDLVRRDHFWNPRAKFVIVIEYIEDLLQDISDFLIYNHIYDVAVVAYGEDEEVLVYTFGLEHDECDRPVFSKLQLLSRCSEIHNFEKIYVAERKTSLRGCHVKFVSHEFWPFISFSEKEGIEDYILKLIQDYEEITVDLVNFGKPEKFGSALDNFTYTGMLHEIEIYNVEGAVGGYILTLNRMSNLDFIDPFMLDYYRIIIARGKRLNKWYGVLKQIGLITVWIIFGTFCFSCIIVTSMGIFEIDQKDTGRDILIVWGYFLGNISHTHLSKSGGPYRLVILSILMYVYIISTTIQASLLSATTQPIRDYQPEAVEDVVSNNYRLILSSSGYTYLRNNPSIINNQTMSTTICKVTLDCMIKVSKNPDERLFTVASDIYHQIHTWNFADENGDFKIYTIKESLGTLLQTMYIRRGSSLAEPFNRLLLRARSSGLIQHFVEIQNYKERIKHKFHAWIKKPQSMKGLKGVFMVLVYGYGISLMSLLLEYLLHRMHLGVAKCVPNK